MVLPLDDTDLTVLHRLPLRHPFSTAMAYDVGVTRKALHRLVVKGALRRPVRTGYVWAGLPDTLETRVELLELVVPPGCFVADHTAAWLHVGQKALLPNAHLTTPKPDIFRHSDIRALRNPLVRSGERAVLPRDLMQIGGLQVTTPLRTGCDLLRLFQRDVGMWGLCCMLGTGTFSLEQVYAEIPRYKGERGVVQLRALAPLADGAVQSFGEAALLLRWYDAGLPRPRCQIPIVHEGRVVFWLDMGLEELLFAAEYDGAEWHDGDEAEDHDEARRGWLDEQRHWWIEVFRQVSVFGLKQDADLRLRAAYEQARALRGTPTFLT
jgi:hypothetical protein